MDDRIGVDMAHPIVAYPGTPEAAAKIKASTFTDSRGCWVWQGHIDAGGYGMVSLGSHLDGTHIQTGAHRCMYEATVGAVPRGLVLDHLCRNRACVNPGHLEPVTHAENMRRGIHATKTVCKYGHDLTPENVYSPPLHPTWRYCRACIDRRAVSRAERRRKPR